MKLVAKLATTEDMEDQIDPTLCVHRVLRGGEFVGKGGGECAGDVFW